METRKSLRLQRDQLQKMNDRLLGGMKVLAAKAEQTGEELEALKAEADTAIPGYKDAMQANIILTEKYEKIHISYLDLRKTAGMVERALEESNRIRKKLYYENMRLRQLLEGLGYKVENKDGLLELTKEGAEQNEDQ